jgi:hypothetical protein
MWLTCTRHGKSNHHAQQTKYVEGRALRKASACAVVTFVLEDLILHYGCIGKIVTDNGPEFKGALSELLTQYNIP